ncbi:HEAT repeat domain-containing protein [Sphingobacterium sp. WOUb80]|uniref:HEAT repeat domain-containing protein n=1 Tax=Sphingobacterium sp. WOUb80 TaxID=3234028 RepID=UPI003CFA22F0
MYYDFYLYYLSYLSSLYNGYPLIIRMTLVMVMVLAVITLCGILRLLFIGYKINKEERRKNKTKQHFEEKLDFVMRNKANYDVEEIQALLDYDASKAKKWKLELVTDLVLSVKNTVDRVSLLNVINYKNCLEALGLTRFWEKRMRVTGIDRRREVLQIVGEIDNGVNSGVLSKSTFHKDIQLRKTARDLYTSQDTYNPFRFMEENFDEAFTQLDKLRLHATLIKKSNEGKLPNLLRWINNSKNPNYIIFVLREIGFFKQYEASTTLLTLLDKQENKDVRAQIVITLGELDYFECAPVLIERFALENSSVREAIIRALGNLKDEQTLTFLVETYQSTEDVNIKLLVARSIKCHGEKGQQMLNQLKEDARSAAKEKENVLLDQVFSENIFVSA